MLTWQFGGVFLLITCLGVGTEIWPQAFSSFFFWLTCSWFCGFFGTSFEGGVRPKGCQIFFCLVGLGRKGDVLLLRVCF